MAGVVGIEPTTKVLETSIIPFNYTPKVCQIFVFFHLLNVALPTQLLIHLQSVEQQKSKFFALSTFVAMNLKKLVQGLTALLVVPVGFEPTTKRLRVSCSTTELQNRYLYYISSIFVTFVKRLQARFECSTNTILVCNRLRT